MMKTIGLIGGMSWESTKIYYQLLNQLTRERLGGLHSAKICMLSVDFAELADLMRQNQLDKISEILVDSALSLQKAGADCVLVCSNTMHRHFENIQNEVALPCLHIVDACAAPMARDHISKAGLLGTGFTMRGDFIKERFSQKHHIETITPDEKAMNAIDRIIFEELCVGKVKSKSRAICIQAIDDLQKKGAQAIILGCTELELLITSKQTRLPLYETCALHVNYALDWALS
ncbi:MAG: amino acid racemase, partial [Pseudomonadota bacterium]